MSHFFFSKMQALHIGADDMRYISLTSVICEAVGGCSTLGWSSSKNETFFSGAYNLKLKEGVIH